MRRWEEITAAMEKIAADRRRGEQDLDEQESHVHKIRARLMELKTNKEYQAHLFEIDIANKKKNAIEEKVLLAMEQGEAKQNELKEVQKLVDEAAQSFSHKKTDLKSQAYERDQELQALKAKKEEILQLLDKPVLMNFQIELLKLNKEGKLRVQEHLCFVLRTILNLTREDQLMVGPPGLEPGTSGL